MNAVSDEQPWGERGTVGPVFAGRITFENVSYEIAGRHILQDVSFTLRPGEITCLLGPSGCGKTSLLRLAAGVAMPTRGRILLDDRELSGPKHFVPPEKRGVGLMFQDYALFPHMTVLANVAYGLTALNKDDARITARRALDRVGLGAYQDQYPSQLSGGEQQRVALARAIVPRPQVMLMDEPFSGLDQRLRDTVRTETLALLRESRATTMLVTHDPIEAMDVADRIVLMRAGRLVQISTPNEAFNNPVDAGAARFYSDFNEFIGNVNGGKVMTPLGAFNVRNIADGIEVTVMIRPQCLQLTGDGTGFSGRVMSFRYLGDRCRCTISLGDGTEDVVALFDSNRAPKLHDIVNVRVVPEDVLIFTNQKTMPN